jgi:hypothetical protein
MTPEQLAYIERRRLQIRYWPVLSIVLLLALLGAYGWLWLEMPLNLNPVLVIGQFQEKMLPPEQLVMLAARGSLALAGCGLFMVAIILLITLSLRNEARLIRLLDEQRGTAALAAGAPEPADAPPADAAAAPSADSAADDMTPPAGHA